jgi:hypothetical protein
LLVTREKSLCKPRGTLRFAHCASKWVLGFLRPFGTQVARGMAGSQHAQQEQTLVILLHTILSHLAHDEIPNLRQRSGSVLCQQLLQAGQAKVFISGIATPGCRDQTLRIRLA